MLRDIHGEAATRGRVRALKGRTGKAADAGVSSGDQ